MLSARTKDRLKAQVQNLLTAIREPHLSDNDLAAIAYTLQVGREAMAVRLGLFVDSLKDIETKLQGFLDGQDGIAGLFRGQIKKDRETLAVLRTDADLQQGIIAWIRKGKYPQLLDLWVKGLDFDWDRLYGETKPCRISLPTYPFARERYWIDEKLQEFGINKNTSHQSSLQSQSPIVNQKSPIPKPKGISLHFLSDKRLSTPVSVSISATALQQELRVSLANALYIEPQEVAVDESFMDMGLDSILGVEWVRVLNNCYGTSIPVTRVYDHPTIMALADFLTTELPQSGPRSTEDDKTSGHFDSAQYDDSAQCDKAGGTSNTVQELSARVASPPVTLSEVEVPIRSGIPFKSITFPSPNDEQAAIAIIGISGQFPRSKNVTAFWDNIAHGRDCISEIPSTRWSIKRYYDPDPAVPGKTYSKWMGVLEGADCFDPLFFNISPAEAEVIDPQQRLFLEHAWRSLEDAGVSPASISGSQTGVFAGCGTGDYGRFLQEQEFTAQGLLGGSSAILSARIAYVLNLQGPCLAIDTACSSSLVAIAEACQSLHMQTSDMAFAGGVCVLTGPALHLMTSSAGMLSKDGRCFTFDARANGFVPGEGVGVLVLKRLADAVQDLDHIYGVIRGWGINQDGKTNGITAPSVQSQIRVERGVYQRFGVHPESISLVEAHGTGTSLGDPIEVEALTTAFRAFTQKQRYCALGSVKSNIGHLLTAAGVAGVIKVLLALQHSKLPPTIHVETLNEHIVLDGSPFYVNTELRPWDSPSDIPRRAAVSSFGFSGTNAHLVIEEYRYPELRSNSNQQSTINNQQFFFVLSAKTPEQLKIYAAIMKDYVESNKDLHLADITYTLQVGRQAMDYRLAYVTNSKEALLNALEEFIDNTSPAGLLTAQVKKDQDGANVFEAGEDADSLLHTWIRKRKWTKIATLWVNGLNIDWNMLYGTTKPRRISLPTYPFARERYWIDDFRLSFDDWSSQQSTIRRLHPLLHQNTSDLFEQRFSSTFTGQELFFADHVMHGQRMLSGAALLEMVRAAVHLAAEPLNKGTQGIRLTNIVWITPIVVEEQPVRVHIELFSEGNRLWSDGEIAFEIYSRQPGCQDVEPFVHSQGRAIFGELTEVAPLDLEGLQAECNQRRLSSSEVYNAFKSMGIDYGPGHRGLDTVYVGSGQVLAKLSLPASVADTQDQFMLHPSLMDAALQASIGFVIGSAALMPPLPFALQEFDILDGCASVRWAWLRSFDDPSDGERRTKLDVDLCDEHGTICVQMKGLTLKMSENDIETAESQTANGTLILHPCWNERAIDRAAPPHNYIQHVVVFCELEEVSSEQVEMQMQGVRCLKLHSTQKGIAERFHTYAVQVFEEIQCILNAKPEGKVLLQLVISPENKQPFLLTNSGHCLSGLSGLLKTARLEHPNFIGQLIEMEPGEDVDGIIEKLRENSQFPGDKDIRYEDGKRSVAGWREIETLKPGNAGFLAGRDAGRDADKDVGVPRGKSTALPWREQGIYLITGGVGGLGMLFAKEIAQHTNEATLILTGRSPLDQDRQARLRELETLGVRIEYRQVDVTHKDAVNRLIRHITNNFGNLHGIIHSAGVIHDNFILKKHPAELESVLAPKVSGVVNLDQAAQDLKLDIFVLFSSMAGVFGNIGQVDYAAANAFLDAYAHYRHTLKSLNQRQGRTLSINWPLWQAGGMRLDAETQQSLLQETGMLPMQTSTGIQALYQGLASEHPQVMIMEGDVAHLKKTVHSISRNLPTYQETFRVAGDSLEAKTLNFVKHTIAKAIKLTPEKIQPETPFEKYGIDSLMQMNLIRGMETVTGELPKTLLFEYPTIQELTEYLVKQHGEKLLHAFQDDEVQLRHHHATGQEAALPSGARAVNPAAFYKKPRLVRLRDAEQISTQHNREDIAIIGISGRYPQSRTLKELWEHLKAGHNCITEVPSQRWQTSLRHSLSGNTRQLPDQKYYGGFIDRIDRFDHHLFDIPEEQVWELSPELRLFLEIVWETFEDAGYTREVLQTLQMRSGKGIGVFVGTMYNQYAWSIPSFEDAALSSNGTDWQIANRTSHFFDLTGPSISVNSACSSSLTAIHLACESLKQQSCAMAIAGGVNLTLDQSKYDALQRAKFLGSGDRSKSFGAGDGYIPGEGVGAVLLKPISLALQDHDRIYALIKGTVVNHSGGRQTYSAPDPKQQTKLIVASFQRSGIDPTTIGYVESAANGSELGDSIEVVALKNAFAQYTDTQHYCALGSVKSNLGHLEAASGISQLSKVLLQLQHQTLVPTINANPRNPNIMLDDSVFYLQEELSAWHQLQAPHTGSKIPRRSMINSFGAGGAYANLIVEEFIRENPLKESNMPFPQGATLCIFSAKTAWSLFKYFEKMQRFVEQNSFLAIDDIACALLKMNHALEYRAAIIASSLPELSENLALLQKEKSSAEDSNVYISLTPSLTGETSVPADIQHALENKDVRQLAKHWVTGTAIEFGQLYEDLRTSEIVLPKYAFDHSMVFHFAQEKFTLHAETSQFNTEFYEDIVTKVSKGELSKEKFKVLITT